MAYFRVQYAMRQLELTMDSLKLTEAQAKDIQLKFRSGAASRLEDIQAKHDVIAYQLRFKQAQNDLAGSFQNLLALEGNRIELDASGPISAGLIGTTAANIEPATVILYLESLETSLENYADMHLNFSRAQHPEALAFSQQAQALQASANSEKSGLYPKLAFQAKTQYQYPNLVIAESAWQNTFEVNLSFTIFDGCIAKNRSQQKLKEASASNFQKEQKFIDLSRDASRAEHALHSLKAQKELNDQNVKAAQEVQRLTYQSFKTGKARYLDVQDAGLRLLQAQVTSAQLETEILNQLAALSYLAVQ